MRLLTILMLLLTNLSVFAQFKEPNDPKLNTTDTYPWKTLPKEIQFQFVSPNYSLSKHNIPSTEISKNWKADAWIGETVQTQLAIWTNDAKVDHTTLEISATDLKSEKNTISNQHISFSPIAYVISDDPSQLKSACGINIILDSTLVADRILNSSTVPFKPNEVRPLWLSIQIPTNTKPGIYQGELQANIIAKGYKKKIKLPYSIKVINQVLTPTADRSFHLDLWQNPYSSARYYNMEVFSKDHLEKIRPMMERLASAGQKNITTTLIYDPWNSQTYDKYDGMIKWVKKIDGTWNYDYTLFDRWVEYMHSIGISSYINCYSMIPWNLSFYYYDEATQQRQILKAKPDEKNYEEHWYPFLKDFAQHLKKKGWFNKTTIAMDERPMPDMQAAIAIIKKADPNFKISLAGYYHPELSDDIIDYSIPFYENMSDEILAARKAKGYKTTSYTCCSEIYPNTFTSSGYYEPIYLMINTLQRGFDGYLRWAFDCWNASPLLDTRFGSWAAGDTYFVYPENETSIRFEMLKEGIQLVEKIKMLKKSLKTNGKEKELTTLNLALESFSNKNINRDLIPEKVKSLKKLVNSL